jgi:hypothetical protein
MWTRKTRAIQRGRWTAPDPLIGTGQGIATITCCPLLAVASWIHRRCAISLLECPSSTRSATSRSRRVSSSNDMVGRRFAAREATRLRRTLATRGEQTPQPSATAVTPAVRSSKDASCETKPAAPASAQGSTSPSASPTASASTRSSGDVRWRWRTASAPSAIAWSISTTSGNTVRWVRVSIALDRSAAVPDTWNLSSSFRARAMPSR